MSERAEHTGTLAMLRNVAALDQAILAASRRPAHLPGLLPFYGPSGYGKSSAATHAANKHRAYYINVQSFWSAKYFLSAVLKQMGVAEAGTTPRMADQVAEQLRLSGRPLIIDEFDYMVERPRVLDLVRDLHEATTGVIVVIGEERLPVKLQKFERFHGRVLEWVAAQPADARDAAALARLYCGAVEVREDLLAHLAQLARGSVRRICVNLSRIHSFATGNGLKKIGLSDWGSRPLYTGDAPARAVPLAGSATPRLAVV